MHNSHNSVPSKASFASAVFAQATLLDIPTNFNVATSQETQAKIDQKTAVVSEVPTFHTKRLADYNADTLPSTSVLESFARKAKSIYERFEVSSRGQETLRKAKEFGIAYDPEDVDFLTLLDEVKKFEKVIARAAERGINWKHFGYNTITTLGLNCITQMVEDEEREEEFAYREQAYLDFASTRGLAR